MKRFVLFLLLVFVMSTISNASMPISSPWCAGDRFVGGGPGSYYNELPYHTNDDGKVSKYAIDFNLNWSANAYSTEDQGYPILCVANGTVSFSGWKTGFGNCVEVNHGSYNSKTVTSFYAHFQDGKPIVVKTGELVVKGQVLGFCGKSGGTSTGNHLHFELRENGQSVIITSMDGYNWCTSCDGHILESKNTYMFDREFSASGGSSKFGSYQNTTGTYKGIHWWHGWNPNDLYGTQNTARRCYIQDYDGGSWGACAIVYDALGGARKAYTVRTGFWRTGYGNGWSERSGPQGDLGMPITNEYANGTGAARQDFQRGYLHYKQGRNPEVTVNLYPKCAPGMTSSGWNPVISYKIARYYETNGARNYWGEPSEFAYNVSDQTWRQNFNSGKYIQITETQVVAKLAEVEQEILPSTFSLHQNYPNPFNPTTTISYSLPVPTHVHLDIFNILGQCVQTLVDEHQSAGEHSVLWTSSGFSSGIYLYRIQTVEGTETKKMILLK